MKTFLSFLVFLGLFLMACDDSYDTYGNELSEPAAAEGETAVYANNSAGEFQWGTCPFDTPGSYDIECGTLAVPENRSQTDAPDIQLAVAIIHAADGAQAAPVTLWVILR